MPPGCWLIAEATPSFWSPPMPVGHSTSEPLPGPAAQSGLTSVRYVVKMLVVPEPSERWTQVERLVGQVHARVERGDCRVVEVGDRPEGDLGDRVAVEHEAVEAGLVVGDGHAAEHGRDVEDGLARAGVERRRDLLVLHERVGAGEVDLLPDELLAATGRADALVVDRDVGRDVGVGADPLEVDGLREARAGAGEAGRAAASRVAGRSHRVGGCLGRRRAGGSAATGRDQDRPGQGQGTDPLVGGERHAVNSSVSSLAAVTIGSGCQRVLFVALSDG